MSRPLAAAALAVAALLAAALQASADGTASSSPTMQAPEAYAAPACPDYGSYAVVDGPRRFGKGVVSAEPYNTCADLPTQARQPQIYIGADVQIGNSAAQDGTGTQGQGQGQQPGIGVRPGSGRGSGGIAGGGPTWSPQAGPVLQAHPQRRH